MPDPNLKIGIFLNFGESWYSLWKIDVADSVLFNNGQNKTSYNSSKNRVWHSHQNAYGLPLSAIYLRGKQLKSGPTEFIT